LPPLARHLPNYTLVFPTLRDLRSVGLLRDVKISP
jgi:hypothetical protein